MEGEGEGRDERSSECLRDDEMLRRTKVSEGDEHWCTRCGNWRESYCGSLRGLSAWSSDYTANVITLIVSINIALLVSKPSRSALSFEALKHTLPTHKQQKRLHLNTKDSYGMGSIHKHFDTLTPPRPRSLQYDHLSSQRPPSPLENKSPSTFSSFPTAHLQA